VALERSATDHEAGLGEVARELALTVAMFRVAEGGIEGAPVESGRGVGRRGPQWPKRDSG